MAIGFPPINACATLGVSTTLAVAGTSVPLNVIARVTIPTAMSLFTII
jgi:hypothetical protein